MKNINVLFIFNSGKSANGGETSEVADESPSKRPKIDEDQVQISPPLDDDDMDMDILEHIEEDVDIPDDDDDEEEEEDTLEDLAAENNNKIEVPNSMNLPPRLPVPPNNLIGKITRFGYYL